jgi:hypothetical protein
MDSVGARYFANEETHHNNYDMRWVSQGLNPSYELHLISMSGYPEVVHPSRMR